MSEENYIYAYYQRIKDGSVTVSRWIKLIYEYLIEGLEDKSFFMTKKPRIRPLIG